MTIYTILNTVNDKAYIGQTIQDYKKRWDAHKWYLRNNCHHNEYLQRSWNKYGEKAFDWLVLEDGFKTVDELNDTEEFWISMLDCYHNGYNANLGGNNKYVSDVQKEKARKANSKPIIQYTLDGEFVKIHDSTDLASKVVGCSLHNITSALSEKSPSKTAKGYQWRYLTDESTDTIEPVKSNRERQGIHGRKGVVQYSLDGTKLKEYSSIRNAGKDNNMSAESVGCGARGRYITAGGFMWRYTDEAPEALSPAPSEKERKSRNKKPIYQYDLDGNFIKKWNSITEASEKTNTTGSSITRVAKGDYNTAGGFKWYYQPIK